MNRLNSVHQLTKNGVGGVHGGLIFGRISDETFGVGEGDVGGRRPVALIVGDDFHLAMLENANAGIGGAQIDTDGLFRGHGDVLVVVLMGLKYGKIR